MPRKMAEGLELLFYSVQRDLSTKVDALVAAIHWKLIRDGYKCVGVGDEWPSGAILKPSERLPASWNSNPQVYALRYTDKTGNKYLLKVLPTGDVALVNFLSTHDEKAGGVSLQTGTYVLTDTFEDFENTFDNLEELARSIQEMLSTVRTSESARVSQSSSRCKSQPDLGTSVPLSVPAAGPRSIDPQPDSTVSEPVVGRGADFDPFNVGRADLDPLGEGGGMLLDLRDLNRARGRGRAPYRGICPPGARFDPFGPLPPNRGPAPPDGNFQFGRPNPDHLPPPPDYDDMFS